VPGEQNDADIFTKNVTASIFERHLPLYVGMDEYLKAAKIFLLKGSFYSRHQLIATISI
jgi:hypothetical protein